MISAAREARRKDRPKTISKPILLFFYSRTSGKCRRCAVTALPSGPDGSLRVSRNRESASTVERVRSVRPDSPTRGSGGSVRRFASIDPKEGLCHCGYSS